MANMRHFNSNPILRNDGRKHSMDGDVMHREQTKFVCEHKQPWHTLGTFGSLDNAKKTRSKMVRSTICSFSSRYKSTASVRQPKNSQTFGSYNNNNKETIGNRLIISSLWDNVCYMRSIGTDLCRKLCACVCVWVWMCVWIGECVGKFALCGKVTCISGLSSFKWCQCCQKPRYGAMPVPGPIKIIGFVGSLGKWNPDALQIRRKPT